MKTLLLLIVAAVGLGACAHQQRELTRDEYLAMTTKSYPGVSQKKLMDTAEQILRYADGSDFKLHHKKNGFLATRDWGVYLVLAAARGTDYWDIEFSGNKVSLSISTADSATTAWAMPDGGVAPLTTVGHGRPVYGDATYRLFWARMDYLLGKPKGDWPTCEYARQQVRDGNWFGVLDPLCMQDVKDNTPA